MHRLFNDRVRSYILVNVKTNSEESSCAKKLFLYGFLLSMLSNMNYVCIHSDKHADQHSSIKHKEDINRECMNAKDLTRLQAELKSTS